MNKAPAMPPIKNPDPQTVQAGQQITTACGSRTIYLPGMESAYYNDKPVYFCLPVCKRDFKRDPYSSCLALSIYQYEE